jgi:hypothetical protein
MTRKDYELIAATIRDLPVDAETREVTARRFAHELYGTNPRFNPDRFVRVATGQATK